ncbi:MAG: aminotransferase class I/II-fold pyridoxal phosphate-dependent enzyme [Vampirovibrio sp.]|nr:aminotransferase class I/II-fold pyridoxal phosphate-dependent enzyme [Vampirovibrio sp.]
MTAPAPAATGTPNVKALYSDYAAGMETYIMFRIAQRVVDLTDELTAKGRPPIKMSIGAPTSDPPQILKDKVKELMDEPGIHTYSVPKGEKYFRDAASRRMKARFGIDINPNTEVSSLIGSKEGLAQMFRCIITPTLDESQQDIILTPDPGYASYQDAIKIAGGMCYPTVLNAENNYMPDFPKILEKIAAKGLDPKKVKALIVNYPSNPIGATVPFSYYHDVIEFARKHNILVISDIAYSEMYFEGEEPPHSVLEVPGAMDIAIEFHSLSKPYAVTGWRLGFAVGNADAVGILAKMKGTADSGLWKVMQKAAAFALESPECDAYIRKQALVYKENQDFMVEGFKKLGWPMEELNLPKFTFYFWLPIPKNYNSCEKFASDVLEKSGVVLVPGTAFGQSGEGFVRLSLVNPKDELAEVIRRLDEDGFHY